MSIPAATATSSGGAAPGVQAAIWQASQETGVDFAYLMEKAAVESSFRPELKASTSSATGLYQFIDSTWLSAMKAHGAEFGLERYAAAITQRGDGGYSVADPELRRQILDLRKDPKISAELVAELTKDNKAYLESKVGGQIGATELYLAHFLGAQGASHFLTALKENPNRAARDVVPEAAASNTPIFYDRRSGQPTTLAQVYQRFAAKFGEASGDIVAAGTGSGANSWHGFGSGRPSALAHVITSVASSSSPLAALTASPLSSSTMLALAALETPDESDAKDEQETPYGSRRIGSESLIHTAAPANDSSARERSLKAS